VIGDPIAHSLSPAIVNAGFAEAGLDWVFTAFRVPSGAAAAALDAMRVLDLGGLSVTMPHKAEVAAAVDRCTSAAHALGAVNCVSWEADELVGRSTDGDGLVLALRHDPGFDVAGSTAAVLGAGGAARSIVLALAAAGAAEVRVVNRTAERAEAAAALAPECARVAAAEEISGCELVVNATSLGMGDGRVPVEPTLLRRGQVVVDIVYHPLTTPFLEAAAGVGARPVDGVGMLVGQAALAFRTWTGVDAPLEAMRAGALASLRG
jgi:shikimate dehydrogenase